MSARLTVRASEELHKKLIAIRDSGRAKTVSEAARQLLEEAAVDTPTKRAPSARIRLLALLAQQLDALLVLCQEGLSPAKADFVALKIDEINRHLSEIVSPANGAEDEEPQEKDPNAH